MHFLILAAIALALTGHAAQSEPTVLTVEQEKTKAAKPGSDFKECANGCPVMIVILPANSLWARRRTSRTGMPMRARRN